ncbi:hypothetical protein BDDG_07000 [Blastomyces dermatitidis ATCC 18188]|uniref:Uncharacterized protein n=1 Tax=Ajellomyces dermatitidis (strain ATCC 18188 / CBS 674.68) TaxID=653446 RepID=F2TLE2_AJEDA|nr:hypothetical protein BDDG_07000 [Blastomyces dermatitidis ATCC 18188]
MRLQPNKARVAPFPPPVALLPVEGEATSHSILRKRIAHSAPQPNHINRSQANPLLLQSKPTNPHPPVQTMMKITKDLQMNRLPPNSSPMGGDKIPHVNDEDGEIISVAEEARSNADGNSDAGEGEDIIPLNEWSTRFCPDDGEIEILRFIWDPSCVTPAHFDDPEQADRRLDEMLKQGAYDDSPVGCQSKLLERVCSVYSKSSNDFGNLYSVTWRPYWSRKLSR